MGSSSYDHGARLQKATTRNFAAAKSDKDSFFEQNKKRKAHESMLSVNAKLRESVDSPAHPAVIPVIIGLDVTGSMHDIPADLLIEGLPKIMSHTQEKGADIALLFTAVGDHKTDDQPFQVGQFESGDDELDLWLQRTWLEGGGGGNGGESYQLAWLFAAQRTKTDHWDKRGKKGYIFTVGDEPVHATLSARAIKEIFDETGEEVSTVDLLKAAQERWHVYHITVRHTNQGVRAHEDWKSILGENALAVERSQDVDKAIIEAILSMENAQNVSIARASSPTNSTTPSSTLDDKPNML